jgi:hypothetical protein
MTKPSHALEGCTDHAREEYGDILGRAPQRPRDATVAAPVGKALCRSISESQRAVASEGRGHLQAFTAQAVADRRRTRWQVAALDSVRGRIGRYNWVVIPSVPQKIAEERSLCEKLDAYLLGEIWLSVGWGYITRLAVSRTELQEHLARFRESRLAPFLERAGLTGDIATVPDEQFRERALRLRCYLAEPDDPSDELLARLQVVARLSNLLSGALGQRINLLELKRALRPLQKSLASVAPELHPLCYSIAEHLARIGEHSPEDPDLLHQETVQLCREWLNRLYAYWRAVLG